MGSNGSNEEKRRKVADFREDARGMEKSPPVETKKGKERNWKEKSRKMKVKIKLWSDV